MLRLYPDFRVGGKPKFILADEPPKLMFIPDQVRKCVVFIGYRLPSGEMSLQGTGFLVGRTIEGTGQAFYYLVTAAHVIQGISSIDNFDGKVLLRMNFLDGNAYTVESDISNWKFHPDEIEVDVAVLPNVSNLADVGDIQAIALEMFLNEQIRVENDLGLGDEVFLTGLFHNHHGKQRNIPIVRAGNIAAMPEEKVRTRMGFIDAYLVEARSIGGISGSPVFLYQGIDRKYAKNTIITGTGERASTFFLLGLMHGHYNLDLLSEDAIDMDAKGREVVNMGIAIVVPSEKILEVINQPMIREPEDAHEKQLRESQMPTLDSIGETKGITQAGFEDALKMASRKISEPVSEKKETSE